MLVGDTARSYAYDRAGNRTSDQYGAYTTNGLNQYEYASLSAEKLVYDENGNLKKDENANYYYDGENHLIRTDYGLAGGVIDYAYDYLGRRISKSVNGTVTKFVYDGWNLIVELNGSSGVLRQHIWGLEASGTQSVGGAGSLLLTVVGGTTLYPLYDASHNIVSVLDQSGSTVGAWQYDPYGNIVSYSGAYGLAYPFLHATKYFDMDTGFYYYGMRYYNPYLGRFMHRDPSGESGGANLYEFDRNNPVQNLDAIGLDPKSDEERREEEEKREAERKAAEEKARRQTRQYTINGTTVTVTTASNAANIPKGNVIIGGRTADDEVFINLDAFQERNTGGYTPSQAFGNTRITYDNYGDPTSVGSTSIFQSEEDAFDEEPAEAPKSRLAAWFQKHEDMLVLTAVAMVYSAFPDRAEEPMVLQYEEGQILFAARQRAAQATQPTQSSGGYNRYRAIREALSDNNGRLLSRAELAGVKFTARRIERLGYRLEGAVKYGGNQGIDLRFGNGPLGRLALAEAKASSGLGSLKVDSLGIRQGSFDYFSTRLQRAGRTDLLQELNAGNVDLFGGFAASGRLYRFNASIFLRNVNFRTTPQAATLIP